MLTFDTENKAIMQKICTDNGIELPTPCTFPKMWDSLISHFIEPLCHDPTFLIGHPIVLSPLAKSMEDNVRTIPITW